MDSRHERRRHDVVDPRNVEETISLVLCRHGATVENLSKRFLSHTDAPLGAHGREQCERLRAALSAFHFERCIVSPMKRAQQTRELVAPDVPFTIEPLLREVHFGDWEGKTVEWAEEHEPELLEQRRKDPVAFRFPGGESIEDAAMRIRPIAERLAGENATLVIGHRVTLGALERLLRRLPLDSQLVEGLQPAEFRVVRA